MFFCRRYENIGYVATRYASNVRQRVAAVFFCILHFWYYWCSIVGRTAETTLFFKTITQYHVPGVSTSSIFFIRLLSTRIGN